MKSQPSPSNSAVTMLQIGESWCIFTHSERFAQIFRRLRRAKNPAGLCPAPRWTPIPSPSSMRGLSPPSPPRGGTTNEVIALGMPQAFVLLDLTQYDAVHGSIPWEGLKSDTQSRILEYFMVPFFCRAQREQHSTTRPPPGTPFTWVAGGKWGPPRIPNASPAQRGPRRDKTSLVAPSIIAHGR